MPLAETIGLDQIRPKDTSSWIDERQRVVVDGRREAELLGIAQKNAPVTIAGQLGTMQAYATWLADTVEGADNYGAAASAIGSYVDKGSVDQAVAGVQTWRTANCTG